MLCYSERSEESNFLTKRCFAKLSMIKKLNREQKVQVCDATKLKRITKADNTKFYDNN